MKNVTLPLAYKDMVNTNNFYISIDVLKDCIDDKIIQTLLSTHQLFIKPEKLYGKRKESFPIDESIGIIKKFDLNNLTADISLFDDDFDTTDKSIFLEYNVKEYTRKDGVMIIQKLILTGATIKDSSKSAYKLVE